VTLHRIFSHGSVSITSFEPPEGSGQPPYVELWRGTQLLQREPLSAKLPLMEGIGEALSGFSARFSALDAVVSEKINDMSTTEICNSFMVVLSGGPL
jgi:hypothetical protein